MADPIFDARGHAGNSFRLHIHQSDCTKPTPEPTGPVSHPAMPLEVQAQVLSVVGDHGLADIGDLITALADRSRPVSAVLSVLDAGNISQQPVLLTATLRVSGAAPAVQEKPSVLSPAAADSLKGSTVRAASWPVRLASPANQTQGDVGAPRAEPQGD